MSQIGCCCSSLRLYHDSKMGFWSLIIALQLVVSLVYVVALVLLVLAALKAWLSSGCQQIYILGDKLICGQTLETLRGFLHTFKADWLTADMPGSCVREELLVCNHIRGDLQVSTSLTSVFGVLAAVFSFLALVESCRLHARAVCRRAAAEGTTKSYEHSMHASESIEVD